MKRVPTITTLLSATVLLLTAAAALAGNRPLVRVTDGAPIPDQYIVVFSDKVRTLGNGRAVHAADALAQAFNASYDRAWEHALKGAVFHMNDHKARAMARHPLVDYVAEDGTVPLTTPRPTKADQVNPPSWGLDRIDQRNLPLDFNYHYDYTGLGVTVYVIGTGIRTTHADFGGRASWGVDFVDGTYQDCNGHDTHIAGTVGGTLHGVAKEVSLVAVRVLNCAAVGSWSQVMTGVDWVTGNAVKPAVAHMGLGGGLYQPLNDIVNHSVASGVFYVVTAGSNNSDACYYSPASASDAFTVAATDSTDTRTFSNWGTCVDIFAPGMSITSAWNTSDTATLTLSGTAHASPHVAGVAALILEEVPNWTPTQVADRLRKCATAGVVNNPGEGSPNLLLYSLSCSCTADHYLADFSMSSLAPLWEQSNRCVAPFSAPDHWSYTQTATCGYDTGTANSGTMISDGWSLYGFDCLRIKFRHYWETESWPGAYDQHQAELSLDGGKTYTKVLDYKDARDPSSGGLWVEVDSGGISIPEQVSIKLRFSFDTVDGVYNDYLGCYIDDVELWGGW